MEIIKGLEWRYATKKFDSNKKIPNSILEDLKKAIQLSASSYGLQPYQIIQIEDTETRQQLYTASYNQSQIVDASHLFVFCSQLEVSSQDVKDYFHLKAQINHLKAESLEAAVDFVSGAVSQKTTKEMQTWTANQTYIAVGTLLAAAGEASVDTCPMEGFETVRYNEILGLTKMGLTANVVVALGYRSAEDKTSKNRKTRKPKKRLFQKM